MALKDLFTSRNRVKNNEILGKVAPELLDSLKNSKFFKSLGKVEQETLRKRVFSEDLQEVLRETKVEGFEANKNAKEIFYHFFGMNENWKWGRNIAGMIMVHSPEYPTYFIPTYTQTSQTGNPGHVKKGEIPRGLITGGLEGVAIGALVSGAKLKPKEMVPYIILGAALQFLSSTLFPWLGEKVGRGVYRRRVASGKINPEEQSVPQKKEIAKDLEKPQAPVKPSFSGSNPCRTFRSSGLRI